MRKTWDDQIPALKVSWMLKKASLRKNSLINQEDRYEVFRIALYSNTVFNEMWLLTVDPLV